MAIFQTWFPPGQQQYFYLLKVVNPGSFQVSPARVQPMYQTGVMATSETRRLEVQIMIRLFAIHAVGNALVLGLAYYWLGIGESSAATLAWSAALAVVILSMACCLHGGTLVFFRADQPRSLSAAFRTVLRHMAPFLAAVILIAAVYWLLAQWAAYSATPALRIASWCTLKLRKPIKPAHGPPRL